MASSIQFAGVADTEPPQNTGAVSSDEFVLALLTALGGVQPDTPSMSMPCATHSTDFQGKLQRGRSSGMGAISELSADSDSEDSDDIQPGQTASSHMPSLVSIACAAVATAENIRNPDVANGQAYLAAGAVDGPSSPGRHYVAQQGVTNDQERNVESDELSVSQIGSDPESRLPAERSQERAGEAILQSARERGNFPTDRGSELVADSIALMERDGTPLIAASQLSENHIEASMHGAGREGPGIAGARVTGEESQSETTYGLVVGTEAILTELRQAHRDYAAMDIVQVLVRDTATPSVEGIRPEAEIGGSGEAINESMEPGVAADARSIGRDDTIGLGAEPNSSNVNVEQSTARQPVSPSAERSLITVAEHSSQVAVGRAPEIKELEQPTQPTTNVSTHSEIVATQSEFQESSGLVSDKGASEIHASPGAGRMPRRVAAQEKRGEIATCTEPKDGTSDSNEAEARAGSSCSASGTNVDAGRPVDPDQAVRRNDPGSAQASVMRDHEPGHVRDPYDVVHAYKTQAGHRPIPSEMHVTVRTPEAGNLEVRAFIRDGRFGASVTVERADVRDALVSDLPILESALTRHDVDVDHVTISGPTTGLNTDSGGARDSQQRQQQFMHQHQAFESRSEVAAAALVEESIHTTAGLNVHA